MERRKPISQTISEWTKESHMLPKKPEEIDAFMEKNDAVVLTAEDGKPLAFGAVTFHWGSEDNQWKELGTIIVNPRHRRKGLGHKVVQDLVAKAKNDHPKARFFALCNDQSRGLFLDVNGEVITDPNTLPQEVWGECVNCPKYHEVKKLGKLCCDTPIEIK